MFQRMKSSDSEMTKCFPSKQQGVLAWVTTVPLWELLHRYLMCLAGLCVSIMMVMGLPRHHHLTLDLAFVVWWEAWLTGEACELPQLWSTRTAQRDVDKCSDPQPCISVQFDQWKHFVLDQLNLKASINKKFPTKTQHILAKLTFSCGDGYIGKKKGGHCTYIASFNSICVMYWRLMHATQNRSLCL